MNALLRDDPQSGLLQHGVDLAGQVPPRRVRLDNRKCAFGRHRGLLRFELRRLSKGLRPEGQGGSGLGCAGGAAGRQKRRFLIIPAMKIRMGLTLAARCPSEAFLLLARAVAKSTSICLAGRMFWRTAV